MKTQKSSFEDSNACAHRWTLACTHTVKKLSTTDLLWDWKKLSAPSYCYGPSCVIDQERREGQNEAQAAGQPRDMQEEAGSHTPSANSSGGLPSSASKASISCLVCAKKMEKIEPLRISPILFNKNIWNTYNFESPIYIASDHPIPRVLIS